MVQSKSFAAENTLGENIGVISGKLAWSALVLDSHFSICYSGKDNAPYYYFTGVAKLVFEKWGLSLDSLLESQNLRTGRNTFNEAEAVIRTAINTFGKCTSDSYKKWYGEQLNLHFKNLDEFHVFQK